MAMNPSSTHEPEVVLNLPDSLKPLAAEVATYRRELPRLLEEGEAGRFAVICGDKILDTWDTYRDALQYGNDRCGDQPFMVQRIDPRDRERLEQLFPDSGGASCPS
jgi:hypothetical protein